MSDYFLTSSISQLITESNFKRNLSRGFISVERLKRTIKAND